VRVTAAAAPEPDALWLLVWRVARWSWPEGRLPTARELDEVAPGRRVLVSTLDMHRGAVSSAGLAAIGLSTSRATAGFGHDVTCDRQGRPTGELWETAYGLALQRALTDTIAHADEAGVQAVLPLIARLLARWAWSGAGRLWRGGRVARPRRGPRRRPPPRPRPGSRR
jgi:predicted amidohydrolase YtcJ